MGKSSLKETSVLLLDQFDEDGKMLYQSLRKSGFDGPVFTCSDDGFLPRDVQSIYTVFLGKKQGRPRYFNEIDVPDYWEIKGNNTSGQVYDLNHERARIFYSQPTHKRFVRVVDWYDDRQVCRISEHYDRYGDLYAKTIFNKKGQLFSRSYYDTEGKEKIVENFVTNDIIVNNGNEVVILKNKTELVLYVFNHLGIQPKRLFFNSLSIPFFVSERLPKDTREDILFWQENVRDDIPGNMLGILNGTSNRASKIYVQKKDSYEKFMEKGVNPEICQPLGYIYPFKKENQHTNKVLICTNSDHIEKLTEIVQSCPNMEFHITALTEMSSKLLAYGEYDNVHLYPSSKDDEILKLFDLCDYYLDINHGNEIVNACKEAFLHNCLLLGFKETSHHSKYLLDELVYEANLYQDLIKVLTDSTRLDILLRKQRTKAMSQTVEDYRNI